MSISITYNTSTENNVTQEFSMATELKNFISTNKNNFIGVMKVVCDNSITDCTDMFRGCANITSLNLSEFDTSKVTNMRYMFYDCKKLSSLDVSNFDTLNVTNMNSMFSYCSSLTSLDLSNFNTSQVTDMYMMFHSCGSLTSLDVSNFNTSNLTSIDNMFSYCGSLTNLNISNFDTSNITDMASVFLSCDSLINLDLSNFDTSKVTNVSWMFRECSSLETIYCEQNWKSDKITNSIEMFYGCAKLKGAIPYNSTKTDINYANPDTGYFSYLPLPPAITFLANLNMDQNEIKNMLLDKRKTTPDSPAAGQIYYNTTDKKIYVYNGTEWKAGSGFESSLKLVEAQPYESPEVI